MFGLSFGISKSKSTSDTKVDKTTTTNQTQSENKASTGSTATTGTSATQQQQAGTSTQTGTTGQQSTGTQTSDKTSTSFSDSVLSGLEGAVNGLFGTTTAQAQNNQLGGSFDHQGFVDSATQAVQQKADNALKTGINSMYDNYGGRDDSNSMVALLANQARADTAGVVAGARSSAEAQAQDIEQKRYLANQQGVGQSQSFLTSLLGALKGGVNKETGAVATAENTAGQSSTSGATTQTGSETSQNSQNQVTQLSEILNSILNGTEHVVGDEFNKTKGTKIGGGASASF